MSKEADWIERFSKDGPDKEGEYVLFEAYAQLCLELAAAKRRQKNQKQNIKSLEAKAHIIKENNLGMNKFIAKLDYTGGWDKDMSKAPQDGTMVDIFSASLGRLASCRRSHGEWWRMRQPVPVKDIVAWRHLPKDPPL